MKPEKLLWVRDEFCFTQKIMSEILGVSESAYHSMEKGTRAIPKYIENHALVLPMLNNNMLLKKHIANIGVELPKKEDA